MNWQWTSIVAITQWVPVIMYLIIGPLWLAGLWIIPAATWTALAVFKYRDRRYS